MGATYRVIISLVPSVFEPGYEASKVIFCPHSISSSLSTCTTHSSFLFPTWSYEANSHSGAAGPRATSLPSSSQLPGGPSKPLYSW